MFIASCSAVVPTLQGHTAHCKFEFAFYMLNKCHESCVYLDMDVCTVVLHCFNSFILVLTNS